MMRFFPEIERRNTADHVGELGGLKRWKEKNEKLKRQTIYDFRVAFINDISIWESALTDGADFRFVLRSNALKLSKVMRN